MLKTLRIDFDNQNHVYNLFGWILKSILR